MNVLRILLPITILSLLSQSCNHAIDMHRPSVVNEYIDSIITSNTRITHFGKTETFWEDEYVYGNRRKQWIYTDSIEKYCNTDELLELYNTHESPIIRMVAFHLLLKNNPKEAVRIAVKDIDQTDSLLRGRCDEALEESASSIRIRMIQQWPKKYDISVEDSLYVDSAVINSPNRESLWYFRYKFASKIH